MNETWLKALVLTCLFGAVLLAVDVLVGWMSNSRAENKAINLRLKLIGQGRTHGEVMTLLRRTDTSLRMLPPMLQAIGRKFERMLMAAQVAIPTRRLMLILVLAPAAIFALQILVLLFGNLPVTFGRILLIGTVSFLLGFALPVFFLNFKANKTRKKMQEQFPVALDVFVRGLRAGHPIAAALDLLTVEMPDPIGSQFGIVVDEVTYGAELRDALQSMAERWELDDMRMFVVSLSVQSETGGNLAEILENLSKVIRDRHAMFLKVRALSSEGRMTAIMLTALPIFAFSMLFLFNPAFFLDVSDDPAFIPGWVALITLYITGFMWIRRLVDLKV